MSALDQDGITPRIQSLIESSGRPGGLDNLTVSDCIDQYGVDYLTSREDLILIQQVSKPANESLRWETVDFPTVHHEAYRWICPGMKINQTCVLSLDQVRANASDWRPYGHRVRYYLSRPLTPQLCRVNFNTWLALGVISCNLIKTCALTYMVLYLSPDRLLVLGDAIQSFLAYPDTHSKQSCLASVRHVRNSYHGNKGPWQGPMRPDSLPKHWISTLKVGGGGPWAIYL